MYSYSVLYRPYVCILIASSPATTPLFFSAQLSSGNIQDPSGLLDLVNLMTDRNATTRVALTKVKAHRYFSGQDWGQDEEEKGRTSEGQKTCEYA